MAFVITSGCQEERAALCLDVCPVDCIDFAKTQYVIDPDICIDCGACETVCPVEAIYHEDELLAEDEASFELAKNHFRQ